MAEVELSSADQAMLGGEMGGATQLAMQFTVKTAEALGAPRLIDIESAHVTSCFYTGRAGVDFAELLVDRGAKVRVPTTLNTGWLDLKHPEIRRNHPWTRDARRLMELYHAMGCEPTWTCAPYHLPSRPGFGVHVAWAESNAVTFANSALGARSTKYGDFTDICAALTGRVPEAGLHRTAQRRAQIVFRLGNVPSRLLEDDTFFHALGHYIGRRAQSLNPVIDGLNHGATEDQLRAIGAAANSSGGVNMFHLVGVTPEAETLDDALQGGTPRAGIDVRLADIRAMRDDLSTADAAGDLSAVCVGTPHLSVGEFERLAGLVRGRRVHEGIDFYISTSRHVADIGGRNGWLQTCESAGIKLVVDTCTYYAGILDDRAGVVMTSSAKWAYYAPSNLRVRVLFGSMRECVESAVCGEVWRDEELWSQLIWSGENPRTA
jgi:predicted aconitase